MVTFLMTELVVEGTRFAGINATMFLIECLEARVWRGLKNRNLTTRRRAHT